MIEITIDWWKLKEIASKSPENYNLLRASNPKDHDELPPIEDILADKGYTPFHAFVNDVEALPDFICDAATFKIVRPLKLMIDGRIQTKSIKDALAIHQVHLPGNELLQIREVMVEEDCCTDRLQDWLKQGWRIIAVCPQPSRRPDYVLGRI